MSTSPHLSSTPSGHRASSSRRFLPIGQGVTRRFLLLAAGSAAGAGLLSACRGKAPSAGSSPTTATPPPELSAPSTVAPAANLPFTVDGAGSVVIEAPASSPAAQLSELWFLGGDYARIASLPLSGEELFGSVSPTPQYLDSYSPAILTRSGEDSVLAEAATGQDYREPQDGNATGHYVVWRSAPLTESNLQTATTVDDWSVDLYDRSSGALRHLTSAQEVNGRADTPSAGVEALPTLSDRYAYVPTMVRDGEEWRAAVLSAALDGTAHAREVARGWFPAATADGVLLAAGEKPADPPSSVSLLRVGAATPERLWSVSSEDDGWHVAGLWADPVPGGWRVACVSRTDGTQPAFLGLWRDGESAPQRWVSTIASTAVASVAGQVLVWGAGSAAQSSEMFLMRLDEGEGTVYALGTAPGYSRPRLSPDGDVVLVPQSDGVNPARWTVCRL